MITRWFAGIIISMVFMTIPIFVWAQTVSTTDPYAATGKCIVDAQVWYNGEISKCLTEKALPLKQYSEANKYEPDPEKIQLMIAELQTEQRVCYEGSALEEYKNRTQICYEQTTFGGVWDLPAVKTILVNSMADWHNLSPEQSQTLAACLTDLSQKKDLSQVSASNQQALAQCFLAAGLKSVAKVYETTGVVVDCAQARFPIQTREDVVRVFANQTLADKEYLEQCVLKKVVPAAAATSVLVVPLATGWQSVFLFGQLLFTQPIMLFRRRKYKNLGRVFDSTTNEPVDLTTIRLITHEASLVSSLVTDALGRYLFLPKPGKYTMQVDKVGYDFPSTIQAKDQGDHYFGEVLEVNETEAVDAAIPIDPTAMAIPVWKFKLKKARFGLAWFLGIISPLISIVGFILLRAWWLGLFVVAHVLVFLIFARLAKRPKLRKFGVVRDQAGKPVSGVRVALFRRGDNKLLQYHVTDLFGRYFFPRVIGEFQLVFDKTGFIQERVEYSATIETSASTIHHDLVLKK